MPLDSLIKTSSFIQLFIIHLISLNAKYINEEQRFNFSIQYFKDYNEKSNNNGIIIDIYSFKMMFNKLKKEPHSSHCFILKADLVNDKESPLDYSIYHKNLQNFKDKKFDNVKYFIQFMVNGLGDSSQTRMLIGDLLDQDEHLPEAMEQYEIAEKLDPFNSRAFSNHGYCYLYFEKVYDLEKALEKFNKAIEIDKKYARAYHYRGLTHFKLGKIKEAMSDYKNAEEYGENHPDFFFDYGCLLHKYEENYKEAKGKYLIAIEKYKNSPVTLENYNNAIKNLAICEDFLKNI